MTVVSFLAKLYLVYAISMCILLMPISFFGVPATNARDIVIFHDVYQSPFTPAENAHLLDVNHVLVGFFVIAIFCIVFLRSVNIPIFFQNRTQILWLIAIILILSVLCIAFFSHFFLAFHQLFFPQGNYAFPADSLLIQTFPLNFWIGAFASLQLITIILLLTEAGCAYRAKL